MDGLLVVDKPIGPTSHDVVARVRRVLGERRIGHTGTLDPMASGVLPLVIGQATRLARFLDQDHKGYDALVCLGISTDSYDAHGEPVGERHNGAIPSREAIDRALDQFRGTFWQQPPAFSAKKIDGRRSYVIAREHARASAVEPSVALPAPVQVTTHLIDIVNTLDDLVALRVVCSSGFYVRALAHDLGQALGTGAHLVALCRTEANGMTLAAAVPLAALEDREHGHARVLDAIIPLPDTLPALPRLTLTEDGLKRAVHGGTIASVHVFGGTAAMPQWSDPATGRAFTRLMTLNGELAAVAEWRRGEGVLHPVVVLM